MRVRAHTQTHAHTPHTRSTILNIHIYTDTHNSLSPMKSQEVNSAELRP